MFERCFVAKMSEKRLAIGLECDSISERLQAFQDGYDFIALDILNEKLQERCFEEYSGLTDEDVRIRLEGMSGFFFFFFGKKKYWLIIGKMFYACLRLPHLGLR